MIAAKQYDMVMGVDIHIIQSPGTVPPIPVPHPFIGMVWDPMQFIPFIGADVWVNGMPGVVAGDEGVAMPPHFPIGGSFVKPIDNECEVFMGSATVTINGEPMSRLGMPVLSCSCIGMPSPPRPSKKDTDAGLKLPTSTLLAIPAGMLVMVGGPPTVSLFAVAMKGAMMGFSFFKRTQLAKKLSDKIHDAASKATKKLPENLRNKVHKGICAVTGHPVEIATGKVFTELVDFELPGPIPLSWERTWYSVSPYEGPLGYGWHHAYDLSLTYDPADDNLAVRLPDGRNLFFRVPEVGGSVYNRQEKVWLHHREEHYVLEDKDGLYFYFRTPRTNRDQREMQPLHRIENAAGFTVTFKYNLLGHLQEILDSGGRLLLIDTDRQGRILTIKGPHPEKKGEHILLVSYAYDKAGNLIKSTDALGASYTYRYEGHLLVQETNRNGLSFYFTYDGTDVNARCLRTWGDNGIYDHKLTYHLEEGYTVVENSLGHRTEYHWTEDGVVYKTVDPQGHEAITKYGNFSQIVSEIDELDRVTHYEYDDLGNRTRIIYPDGSTLQMAYQGRLLTAATDQIGGSWQWLYNEAEQLISRTDPQGNTTTYAYRDGLLSEIVDPQGGVSRLEYDAQHNLTALITPDGARNEWHYDALGRCTKVVDPKGNEQRRKFNFQGWVRQINEPDGNLRKLSYDPEGNVIRAEDKQYDVRFEYTGMNRLKARIQAGTRVEFQYNTEEDLLGIINEYGYAYRFELDDRGAVITESGFDGLTRRYQRDAAGQVIGVERPGALHTRYEYDLQGRVIGVHHSDGSQETYRYREDGELIQADNEHIKVKFERDELGRVLTETQGGFLVHSEYDALGNRIRLTSSLGADVHIYRNLMGDVEEVTAQPGTQEWQAAFTRDLMGLELDRQLPGGVRSQWKRDRLGRPVEHKTFTAGGRLSRSRTYVWDVNDRLKQLIDGDHGTFAFEHDVFGNLAAATYPDGSRELRMPDAVGNLFRTSDQEDRKYGPAGQLLEAKGVRYDYDAEGNLIRKTERNGGVWQYEWNMAGMLSRVIRPDGEVVTFTYDALGRRISKTYRGRTTYWVWDGNVPLHEWTAQSLRPKPGKKIEVRNTDAPAIQIRRRTEQLATAPASGPPAGSRELPISAGEDNPSSPLPPPSSLLVTWLFEPETFAPLAKLRDGQRFSIITDHLGTPSGMYSDTGEKVWEMDLSIYGEVRNLNGWREDCPFRYPGQYEDTETGLYYNRFRYYDPEMGGYVSQDPIGLWGGDRIYAYVNDLVWVDPLALSASNAAQGALLSEDLRQTSKYGRGGRKELSNGRIRYYDNLTPASTPGEMKGMRRVREWDPKTGKKRTWMETIDHSGRVRQVRPDTKFTNGTKIHYRFGKDGSYIGTKEGFTRKNMPKNC